MLHTRRSISDLRIVFSTFRRCMSFYTARVKLRPSAKVGQSSALPSTAEVSARRAAGQYVESAGLVKTTAAPSAMKGVRNDRRARSSSAARLKPELAHESPYATRTSVRHRRSTINLVWSSSAAACAPAPATRFRPQLAFHPKYGRCARYRACTCGGRFRSAGIMTLLPTMRGL